MELDGVPSTVRPPSAVTFNSDVLIPKSNEHIFD